MSDGEEKGQMGLILRPISEGVDNFGIFKEAERLSIAWVHPVMRLRRWMVVMRG